MGIDQQRALFSDEGSVSLLPISKLRYRICRAFTSFEISLG
jgi:hypothetical protein